MGDLISRQAAIDAIVNTVSRIGLHDNSEVARYGATFRQHEIIDIIESLPSAQRTGRWIPVSERLPEDGTWNIFTDGKQVSIERYKMDAIDHFFPAGRFFELEDAVAWMPLPEPYEEEQDEQRRNQSTCV